MHKPTTLCNLIRIRPGKGLSERGTCVCVFTGFWLRSITQRDRPRERTRLRQDMTRQLGDNTHTQTLIPLSKLVSHWFALEHPVEDASVSVSPTTQTHTQIDQSHIKAFPLEKRNQILLLCVLLLLLIIN